MLYRNIASRAVFFENAAAVPRLLHPGNDGFAIRKPGSGRLCERSYFGDRDPRFFDDVRFPFSHSPNNGAGLQVEFANRGALHVTQCDTIPGGEQSVSMHRDQCAGWIAAGADAGTAGGGAGRPHSPIHSRNVLYHSTEFCGFRIQCPSSGYNSSFHGTFCNCKAG
jgi:hypothetical protein